VGYFEVLEKVREFISARKNIFPIEEIFIISNIHMDIGMTIKQV
jgi:hypothetical protein